MFLKRLVRSMVAAALRDERYGRCWTPEEHRQRFFERWYWGLSLALSAVVAAGAILTAAYTFFALREAHRQTRIAQTALIESDRPIVVVAIDPGADVLGTDHNGVPTLRVTLSNLGNKPAFVGYVEGTLTFEKAPKPSVRNLCVDQMSQLVLKADETSSAPCRFVSEPRPSEADIVSGRRRATFFGIVTYRSAAGVRWRRSYSFVYHVPSKSWGDDGAFDSNREVRIDANADEMKDTEASEP